MTKTNGYTQEFVNEVLACMAGTKEPLKAVVAHLGVTAAPRPAP